MTLTVDWDLLCGNDQATRALCDAFEGMEHGYFGFARECRVGQVHPWEKQQVFFMSENVVDLVWNEHGWRKLHLAWVWDLLTLRKL